MAEKRKKRKKKLFFPILTAVLLLVFFGMQWYLINSNKIETVKANEGYINDSIASNELMSIAGFINDDEFWNSQIEQIYFDNNRQITLIPRVGSHIIEFGKAENIEEKLEKLHTFYLNGMNKVGWNKYSKLNIEFSNKVICTQKNKYDKN